MSLSKMLFSMTLDSKPEKSVFVYLLILCPLIFAFWGCGYIAFLIIPTPNLRVNAF